MEERLFCLRVSLVAWPLREVIARTAGHQPGSANRSQGKKKSPVFEGGKDGVARFVCAEYGIWVHYEEYPNIGMSGHVTMRLGQGGHGPRSSHF